MVEGVMGTEGVVGDELRGGGEASVDLGIPAMVVPERVWEARQLRGFKGGRTVVLGVRGRLWLRRNGPGRGGGRADRRG